MDKPPIEDVIRELGSFLCKVFEAYEGSCFVLVAGQPNEEGLIHMLNTASNIDADQLGHLFADLAGRSPDNMTKLNTVTEGDPMDYKQGTCGEFVTEAGERMAPIFKDFNAGYILIAVVPNGDGETSALSISSNVPHEELALLLMQIATASNLTPDSPVEAD